MRHSHTAGAGVRRMVDKAIGYGKVLAGLRFGSHERTIEVAITGTVLAEDEPQIAKTIADTMKPCGSYLGANLEAVRIIMLRGTWQEEVLWSGRWHIV